MSQLGQQLSVVLTISPYHLQMFERISSRNFFRLDLGKLGRHHSQGMPPLVAFFSHHPLSHLYLAAQAISPLDMRD